MSDRTTVMYYYDGTYNGFLSCVFESFAEKETPAAILPVDEADQTCLFGAKYIETDLRRAVDLIAGRAAVEVSGNVTIDNVGTYVRLPIDYLSSGALTHSAGILDLSMKHLSIEE